MKKKRQNHVLSVLSEPRQSVVSAGDITELVSCCWTRIVWRLSGSCWTFCPDWRERECGREVGRSGREGAGGRGEQSLEPQVQRDIKALRVFPKLPTERTGEKNTLSPFITASVAVLSLEGEVLHEPQRRFWLCYSNRLPLGRLARASVLPNSCRGKLRNSWDSLSYQVPFSRDKRKQEGTVAELQRFAGSEQQPC